VTTQLQQILSYLDRDGVTELVIATGRPVAMRQKGAYVNLTARPLTLSMLTALVEGTAISPLIPWSDESPEPTEVDVGKRRLRVRTGRRGDEVVVRLEVVKGVMPSRTKSVSLAPPSRAARTTTSPRSGRTTMQPRTKAASAAPVAPAMRPKAATTSPRTKSATTSPRTKSATTSPRTKSATVSPRAARTTTSPKRNARASTPPKKADDFELPLDYDLDELSMDELTLEPPAPPLVIGAPVAIGPVVGAVVTIEPPRPGAKPQPAAFAKIVAAARAARASDLHIAAGRVVSIRTNAELVPLEPGAAPLTADAAEALLLPLLAVEHQVRLDAVGYVDLAVDAPGGGRLRANISRHQVGLKGTFRLALAAPKTLDELGLPKELAKVVAHHQGFVVIAGPSGHGKTTTLAGLVDLVNSSKAFHILTVEDPIEIEHPRKVAVVSQREAGRHTKSFAAALKASLREDPDVIVIGELRDRETVEIALTASETGHLVLATMSTPSAAKTLDRLIDMFPPEDHSQVRASVAGALRAIVAQRLLPAIGGGVVPAIELVTGVLPLASLIRDDKLYQLPNLMQRGRAFGMIRFDDTLLDLVKTGKITTETALAAAENKKDLAGRLK
jgi:twitching motility protein PilT